MSRRALLAAGLVTLAFGLEQLVTIGPAGEVLDAFGWLAAVLVVHDGAVAPLAVAAGRALPRRGRPVLGAGLAVAALLAVLALPALLGPGVSDNPTVLPRDYGRGLALLVGADVAVTAALMLGRGWRRRAGGTGGRRRTSPR